jgi:hypothetical protein
MIDLLVVDRAILNKLSARVKPDLFLVERAAIPSPR